MSTRPNRRGTPFHQKRVQKLSPADHEAFVFWYSMADPEQRRPIRVHSGCDQLQEKLDRLARTDEENQA